MKIDCLVLGLYETNCYVVRADETTTDCVVIDTALEASGLIEYLQSRKLRVVAIILTHGHADHICGLAALREHYPQAKVYIHQLDADMLKDAQSNLSLMTGSAFVTESADCIVEQGEIIDQAGIRLRVIHTPGHTPGGISLYCPNENVVFVGDTLFADSVGRTDFPGGDMSELVNGIKQKLWPLPDETVVYPGHGPQTTIRHEKQSNPFVR